MEEIAPRAIQFGHVCENPKEWEQRFEERDYEKNRHLGKVMPPYFIFYCFSSSESIRNQC